MSLFESYGFPRLSAATLAFLRKHSLKECFDSLAIGRNRPTFSRIVLLMDLLEET